MNPDVVSQDLKSVLRRLKLSRLLDVLPERFALARSQQVPHQDFLLMVLSDEASRRDAQSATLRAQRAHLDEDMRLEQWDERTKVTFDHALWNELVSLRFIEAHAHVAIVGPVGVGKTFLATALGHIACRRGYTVHFARADKMLKALKAGRLDNTHEAELRRLIAVDLLIVDDFGIDAMDAIESRDAYEIFLERHRSGSMILTSNRGPDEWLATFSDPVRAQSAIDRFTGNAYDLVMDGDTYRPRQKPRLDGTRAETSAPSPAARRARRRRAGRARVR
jgi:DNA replication protein DnaC